MGPLGTETAAAAARIGRIGIVEHESTTHDLILEIDLRPIEIEIALGITNDLQVKLAALILLTQGEIKIPQLIAVLGVLSQIKQVGES